MLDTAYSIATAVPQAPTVNRYIWIKAEYKEREIAKEFGSATILNGVVYADEPKRIGKNEIAVPDGFWKMIINEENDYKKCFYYENDINATSEGDVLDLHEISCNALSLGNSCCKSN